MLTPWLYTILFVMRDLMTTFIFSCLLYVNIQIFPMFQASILRSILFPSYIVPENSHFDEPVPFIWWLLKGIAPLYKHDVAGRIVYKEGVSF